MTRFLADSSIWGWANSGKRPDIADRLAERFERGEIVICAPVALEVLHSARSGDEYEQLMHNVFEPLDWIPMAASVGERALQVQRALARTEHGNHMRPAVDYLIAAVAELAQADVSLWFFDKDLRVICGHTGQTHEEETAP